MVPLEQIAATLALADAKLTPDKIDDADERMKAVWDLYQKYHTKLLELDKANKKPSRTGFVG